jgi:voltage-gated potassium channel
MALSLTQKIKKSFNIRYNRRSKVPNFSLNKEIYAQFKYFRLPLILIQVIFLVGTSGYMIIDDFTLFDALYQTGITFTTVGFGEIAPISHLGRLFTISLIVFGFAIFTLSTTILIKVIVNGKLLDLYKERNMLYKIARLRDHFVIFHHNEYTVQLTKQFRQSHIPFVVVDPREDLEEIAKKYKYPYFVKSQTFSEEAFLKSHLASAKGTISLSKEAAENITLIASVKLYESEINRFNPFLIICNADSEEDILRLKKLGADKVIAPPILMAKRISAMAIHPDMENVLEEFLYKKDTPIDLEEVVIDEHSWVVGKKLKELKLRDVFKVSVVGISTKNKKFVDMPKGDCDISLGSKLILIGTQESVFNAKKLLKQSQAPINFRQSLNIQNK